MNSLISMLKRVGVSKDDIIILAGDGRNSWRKAFDKNYKAQRKAVREEFDINWSVEYGKINKVISKLDEATNFYLVWESGNYNYLDLLNVEEGEKYIDIEQLNEPLETEFSWEADDIAGVCCKVFKDKDIILITKDADWEMLAVNPNVKFFSMNIKWKGGTGVYKQVDNGYKILEKKIRLGDVSDNIKVSENDTERDKEIRRLIIDLINLPKWVEDPIREVLENLPKKECNFDLLPFPNSLARRFPQIYANDKIITVEDSIKRTERKKKKAKKKKIKLKKQMTMRKTK